MKNKFHIITFLLVLLAPVSLLAQKKITEGTITYDIIVNTGDNKPSMASMLDGATNVVYLKGSLSRTELISSLGTQSTITDAKTGNVTVLKEFGEKKYMITMTHDDWLDANSRYKGVTFQYVGEYKEIAGYKCEKAIGTLGDGTTFTVFYTKDLVPENREFEVSNRLLPGLVMEYETTISKMQVSFKVSKISFNIIPASKFELPKTGFRVMTYEESKGVKAGN